MSLAHTKQFDGRAASLFRALHDCPRSKLETNFRKLQREIGSLSGTRHLIEHQSGKPAKRIKQRLAEANLL